MEDSFDFYYCSVCHICKKPSHSPETMKFCSGCKLIQYCSIEHQKQDWPRHRELCKCVKHMMRSGKLGQLYEDTVNLEAEDMEGWNKLRVTCLKLTELALKRSLTSQEAQMFLYPPVCNYCHAYKVNKMFICKSCKSVMYCSKDHQSKDQKHVGVCKLLFLSFEVDMLRFHERNLFNFLGLVDHCNRVNKLPGSMEMFITTLTSTLTTKGIYYSEMLSYSLTFLFVISKIAKISTNQLTIHIVGSDDMECLSIQTFPLIYHLLPHVIHLNIVLIGPTVLENDSIPLCIESSNISVCAVSSLYHEYVSSPKFEQPNMIAVFNCGFCEYTDNPPKDNWKESLSHILRFKNNIVIVTSYTKKESVMDTQRLLAFKNKDIEYNVIMKCKENPFCSLYPHRDWENGEVYYVNKYISVLRT